MGKCTDARYEQMIHSFELGLLVEEDRLEFEQHLLECEYCFEQVRDFLLASKMIRHDSEIRKDSLASTSSATWVTRLRILAAAAVLLAVLVPAYYLGLRDGGTPGAVQRLELLPLRGGSPPVLHLDQGGQVEIKFLLQAWRSGISYDVTIASRDGRVVFADDQFAQFDSSGVGRISLPVSAFIPGFHRLTARDSTEGSRFPQQQFSFSVK